MSKTQSRSSMGIIGTIAELVLIAAIAATIVPIIWMVALSFQPLKNIIGADINLGFSLSNYTDLLAPGNPLLAQLGNSLMIVVGTVLLCLVFGSLAGYALSQLVIPRMVLLPLLALTAFIPLIPPMVLVPGLYATMSSFGLIGGTLGLIILNTVFQLPFAALLMKVYFDGLPATLREAALIDGASEATAFRSVMLPLVKPGLASVGTFTGIMAWNEFLFGLTMTSGGVTAPLTVGIASLVQPFEVAWGQMAAAGTLAAIPIIIITIIANRYIVAGLTAGAVKG
ncbi:multiple sugar transport system permease protein [Arthrobacter pascens]|uniref:carbohydrate ABC transporter permease n=1 Tax=Arthrobacter pascens TaxID=1677 RepID=UPI002860271F|nr:carbohydrate ABC transporter permease [Arthrobacter pascens]MDR6555757.1 multiple sugar transport system permease protein [Arthrobacter pascens]